MNLKKILSTISNNVFLTAAPIAVLALILGIIMIGIIKTSIVVATIMLIPTIIFVGGKIMKKKPRKQKTEKKKKSKFNKIFNIILNIILVGIIACIVGASAFAIYIVRNAPNFDPDNLYQKEASIIYDSDGEMIAKLGLEIRDVITYDDMPQVLIDAIIATEDSRYYQHNGFDFPRFLKASLGQLMGKNAGGASTISMQVVRNNFTESTVSLKRKFTDIYLSIFKLEKNYSKEEILEFYVNAPFLGSYSYGVAEACRSYFGKEIQDINLSEAALIAGLFQAPSAYDPYVNPTKAYERRAVVLNLMVRHGYINDEQRDIANSIAIEDMLIGQKSRQNVYQSFIDTVIIEVEKKTGKNPYSTSMEIYSTMDRDRQDYMNSVFDGTKWKWENDVVQAGVAVTNVKTGAIVALGGGRNLVGERVFNFATMINKQPGSTAKPIYDYGPGVEYENWSTYTPFLDDLPASYSNGIEIKNWDSKYMGMLTLKQSLGLSRNIPALKAFQSVNNAKILEFATKLGMKPELQGGVVHQAHAIGAYNGTNPLQMAAAYAAFGNSGYYIEPYSVTKIVYRETNEIVEFTATKVKAMSDATAYIVTNALVWGVNYGIASSVRVSGYQVASKSGTTDFGSEAIKSFKLPSGAVNDLWTVSYSDDYAMGLWYGYDKISNKNVSFLSTVSIKNRLAKQIFTEMIKGSSKSFKVPNSVVAVAVEKETIPGKLPSAYTPSEMITTEYFKKGTEPTVVSTRYKQLNNVTNLNLTDNVSTVTLSWDAIETPSDFTFEYLTNYFENHYGTNWEDYLEEQLLINAEELGQIGYDIYIKPEVGTETYISSTTDTTYTLNKPSTYGDFTYVIKTSWSIFKSNCSNGAEVFYEHEAPDIVIITVNNPDNILTVGTPYTEYSVTVYVNGVATTITPSDKTITNVATDLPVIETTFTNNAGTYSVKYTVSHKGQLYYAYRTVTVNIVPEG